jgi:sporulation protein YlmC with PRC-barrel domain
MKRIATVFALALMAAPMADALAQQPAPPSTGAPSSVLVGSDSLVGSTVRSSDGHDIGKVNRLMIDPHDGRISTVVISTGGTLGVGTHMISVPWSSVKVGQDRGKVIVTANQTLEMAPNADRARPAADQQQPSDPSQRRQ